MHISLITKSPDTVTGLGRYSSTLYHHLIEQGLEISCEFPHTPLPAPVAQMGRRIGWDLPAFFRSYPVWSQFVPADLYHLTSETLASLLLLNPLRPVVVTVHAFFTYLLRNQPGLSTYNHPIDRWFDQLAVQGLRRADAIIAVSHYVKQSLVEIGISAERIHVVHEAVDRDFFCPRSLSTEFRRKYGFDEEKQYILYVGSEQPRKNFLLLLRAFARLHSENDSVRLIKVGQPEFQREREKALDLIQSLGIEDAVIFCGHVGEDLPLFYNLSDLFVFPSLYEGFGFPPLEAMSCGTPVICSNTTSLPEVVGDAALLFDPLDEDHLVGLMKEMMADASLRKAYRQRGLANAQRFDWATTASRTAQIYRDVLAEHRRTHNHIYGEERQHEPR